MEEFSHIFVLYFLDKTKRPEIITHPGPPEKKLQKTGIFASRSQYRSNHIALRLVKLIEIEKNILTVEGLDAINESKVLI